MTAARELQVVTYRDVARMLGQKDPVEYAKAMVTRNEDRLLERAAKEGQMPERGYEVLSRGTGRTWSLVFHALADSLNTGCRIMLVGLNAHFTEDLYHKARMWGGRIGLPAEKVLRPTANTHGISNLVVYIDHATSSSERLDWHERAAHRSDMKVIA